MISPIENLTDSNSISRYSDVFDAYGARTLDRTEYRRSPRNSFELGRTQYQEAFDSPPMPLFYLSIILRDFSQRSITSNCGGTIVKRPLRPEFVMIAPPHLDWSVIGDGRGPFDGLFVAFPESTLQELMREMPQTEILPQCVNDPCLVSDIKQLWASSGEASPASNLMTEGIFLTLIGRLLKRCGRLPATGFRERGCGNIVRKAVNFIRDNLSVKVSLEEMAAVAGVSRSHLTRVFKKETGRTVHDYLLELRVERAKELILHFGRNMPLSEVARQCGFANHSHLHRVFQHYTGVTPQHFRG